MDNERKPILPFDVSRCWGRWPIGEPCEKRQQCKRYLGRKDTCEHKSIPTTDHLCSDSFSFFIDAKNESETAMQNHGDAVFKYMDEKYPNLI